jgi:monovalent cation:H+ antiporter, CPA1 family
MTHLPVDASTVALMLSIFVVISVVTARLRIPYTVGLVISGLVISFVPHHPLLELTPGLVLFFFLPPLLFDGGLNADVRDMRRNFVPIALLATLGVLLCIGLSYVFLVYGAHLPPRMAVIFGAIVAATDPVAVLALFRALRVDRNLLAIVEGESLFNDGTAVVAFSALMVALSDVPGAIDLRDTLWQFFFMTAGGALIGVVAGYAARFVIRFIADQVMIVAVVTVAVAYGAYLVADDLRVSGIIAVIAAAMIVAGSRTLGRLPADERAQVSNFWTIIAFLANTVLFLLMGTSIHMDQIIAEWPDAIFGLAAVLISRPLIVRGLAPVSKLLGRPISSAWQHAITLAGMRGALSMALVLSLPDDFPGRTLLISMVFSVVLFTVVVQGALLEPVFRALGLIGPAASAEAPAT